MIQQFGWQLRTCKLNSVTMNARDTVLDSPPSSELRRWNWLLFEKWEEYRGQTPAQTETNYLNKVDTHVVKARDGNDYGLELTPTGVFVFEEETKISLFFLAQDNQIVF